MAHGPEQDALLKMFQRLACAQGVTLSDERSDVLLEPLIAQKARSTQLFDLPVGNAEPATLFRPVTRRLN